MQRAAKLTVFRGFNPYIPRKCIRLDSNPASITYSRMMSYDSLLQQTATSRASLPCHFVHGLSSMSPKAFAHDRRGYMEFHMVEGCFDRVKRPNSLCSSLSDPFGLQRAKVFPPFSEKVVGVVPWRGLGGCESYEDRGLSPANRRWPLGCLSRSFSICFSPIGSW